MMLDDGSVITKTVMTTMPRRCSRASNQHRKYRTNTAQSRYHWPERNVPISVDSQKMKVIMILGMTTSENVDQSSRHCQLQPTISYVYGYRRNCHRLSTSLQQLQSMCRLA